MSSDTVVILDASQTYETTIGGGLDGLPNWFKFWQKQMKNRFWFETSLKPVLETNE
jgi:hypothetical protein